jgi:hypothetical protein
LLGSGPILALPRMSPLIEYILSSAQLSVSVCPLSEFTDTDITGPSCLPSTLRSCCVERATRKNQSRKAARYCADIVQYSTSHHNTSQGGCDTVHHNTISQLNTIQYSTIQYNTIQYTYIHVQHNTRTYTYNTIHVHTRTTQYTYIHVQYDTRTYTYNIAAIAHYHTPVDKYMRCKCTFPARTSQRAAVQSADPDSRT